MPATAAAEAMVVASTHHGLPAGSSLSPDATPRHSNRDMRSPLRAALSRSPRSGATTNAWQTETAGQRVSGWPGPASAQGQERTPHSGEQSVCSQPPRRPQTAVARKNSVAVVVGEKPELMGAARMASGLQRHKGPPAEQETTMSLEAQRRAKRSKERGQSAATGAPLKGMPLSDGGTLMLWKGSNRRSTARSSVSSGGEQGSTNCLKLTSTLAPEVQTLGQALGPDR